MTLDPAKAPGASTVAKAFRDGIASCVEAQKKPKIKTFSLLGLEAWGKSIASFTGRQGWLGIFGRRMFWPLKDAFTTIETSGTGGGLMRPMYAEFLEEAGEATRNRALIECAAEYRKLGESWRRLAEAALPSTIKPFKRVKDLRRKRVEVFHDEGAEGLAQNRKSWEELADIERNLTKRFPLKEKETRDLLCGLRDEIVALAAGERNAIEHLASAMK
jgi:hypothetical protein